MFQLSFCSIDCNQGHFYQQICRFRKMGKSKPVAPTYQYYAGWIPREFAEKLLTAEGEFLVRNTQRERGATDLILSAKHGERFYHFIVFYNGGKYYVKVLAVSLLFFTFLCPLGLKLCTYFELLTRKDRDFKFVLIQTMAIFSSLNGFFILL